MLIDLRSLKLLSAANQLLRHGHAADAAKLFQHLLSDHPDFVPYQQGLQAALVSLGRAGGGREPEVCFTERRPPWAQAMRTLEVLLRHGWLDGERWKALESELAAALGDRGDYGLLPAVMPELCRAEADEAWLNTLNRWLPREAAATGAQLWLAQQQPPAVDAKSRFARLRWRVHQGLGQPGAEPTPETPDGLVTVAMSCFNNAATLEAAALSVLGQTHTNLELVIVDDASTDGSAAVAQALARQDARVKLHVNPVNQGTYANRNRVWAESRAEYFCCLDADDIALPGRLAQQLAALQAQPGWMAVISLWVRMTAEGCPVAMNVEQGGFAHRSVSTMMLRREPVLKALGFWDGVRFEADSEYMNRLTTVFGTQALGWQDDVVALALSRLGSLTQDPLTGLDDVYGPSPMRLAYRQAWQDWHRSGERLYMPQSPQPRPFAAPPEMLA